MIFNRKETICLFVIGFGIFLGAASFAVPDNTGSATWSVDPGLTRTKTSPGIQLAQVTRPTVVRSTVVRPTIIRPTVIRPPRLTRFDPCSIRPCPVPTTLP